MVNNSNIGNIRNDYISTGQMQRLDGYLPNSFKAQNGVQSMRYDINKK